MVPNAASLIKYFPLLKVEQMEKIREIYPLYRSYNERINLISRKDIDNFYLHHVLHSLSIAKFTTFQPDSEILDAGTGGGFPGIPLAILFPRTNFLLVDSIGKKIRVVNEISEKLHLKNVHCKHSRIEKIKGKFDFILGRAVTNLKSFLHWTHDKIKPESIHNIDNGIIYLKGGEIEEELNKLRRPFQIIDISDFFEKPYFESKKIIHIPL